MSEYVMADVHAAYLAGEDAKDQSQTVFVSFEYDKQLVDLRRDAAPSAKFDGKSKVWRMRRDDALNFIRSADAQCRERGVEKAIHIGDKAIYVGCQGAESAAAEAAENARVDERRRLDRERRQAEEDARRLRAVVAAKEEVARLEGLAFARKVLADAVGTQRVLCCSVPAGSASNYMGAILTTADGREIDVTYLLPVENEYYSRKYCNRAMEVPVLTGGHKITVTTSAPRQRVYRKVVRAEDVAEAA